MRHRMAKDAHRGRLEADKKKLMEEINRLVRKEKSVNKHIN